MKCELLTQSTRVLERLRQLSMDFGPLRRAVPLCKKLLFTLNRQRHIPARGIAFSCCIRLMRLAIRIASNLSSDAFDRLPCASLTHLVR